MNALFGAQRKSDPHLIDAVSLETRVQRIDRSKDRSSFHAGAGKLGRIVEKTAQGETAPRRTAQPQRYFPAEIARADDVNVTEVVTATAEEPQ